MIEKGKTYTAYNQGRAITPQTFTVVVDWINDLDVYYHYVGETKIRQTAVERFEEITRMKGKS